MQSAYIGSTYLMATNRYLEISRTLVFYDEPQLVYGNDKRGMHYLAVAIPHSTMRSGFLAVSVTQDMLDDYYAETVDLRFVFKRPKKNKYFIFDHYQPIKGRFLLREIHQIDDDWIPDVGIFSNSHTEKLDASPLAATISIGIDGRWDIQDLSQFPNIYADAYSFLFATSPASNGDSLGDLFERYPWRGGYSTVNFYDGLYSRIPKKNRLAVKEIVYQSPGTMKITALPEIADEIQVIVEKINADWRLAQQSYKELFDGMSSRKFLGKSNQEVRLSDSDKNFLEAAAYELCKTIGFTHLKKVYLLVGQDWLAAAKIVASFYRRVSELAEFYDSGKANFKSDQ